MRGLQSRLDMGPAEFNGTSQRRHCRIVQHVLVSEHMLDGRRVDFISTKVVGETGQSNSFIF